MAKKPRLSPEARDGPAMGSNNNPSTTMSDSELAIQKVHKLKPFFATGPTLHDKFPNIQGATQSSDNFDLYRYLGDSWGVLLMHPGAFTPVCTTEMALAATKLPDFTQRNVKLLGFSCCTPDEQRAWVLDIEKLAKCPVTFPIFCDIDQEVSAELGILDESRADQGMVATLRVMYILKPDQTVALTMNYPAAIGRNFDEILRVVDALQLSEREGVALPVNWKQGGDVIVSGSLTNAQAADKYGANGYQVVDLPSEHGQEREVNYLRYTKDPSADRSG